LTAARSARFGLTVLAATASLLAGCNRETLDAAPDVELTRFEGKWYEIAHFARSTQYQCTGTTATYTRRSDGKFTFLHECTLTDGRYRGATALATVRDLGSPAKMEVDFGGFVGDYWIIDVASDYRYAVVGHPSRDYLWVLSRTPTIASNDLDLVLAHAREKNFDTGRLEYTPAGREPEGTPAPEPAYGCSASPRGRGGALALLVAIAMAVGLLVRRRR